MCGRFALKAPPSVLIRRFHLDECAEVQPRYNLAPGSDIAAIRRSPDGRRVLDLMRWGLVPHWAKDPDIGTRLINARGESLAGKPAFRDAFRRRRCLVPADGFYEWKAEGRIRQPYYFSLPSGETMALAGLWESWQAPDGSPLRSVCLVTTAANHVMAPVHDRMPVVVAPQHWEEWLAAPADPVARLIVPCGDEELQVWPVSRRINSAREDDAALIAREDQPPGARPPR